MRRTKKLFEKRLLTLFVTTFIFLTGCQHSVNQTDSTSDSVSSRTTESSSEIQKPLQGKPAVNSVTSELVKTIPAGKTYQEIVEVLGETNFYMQNTQVYLVDQERIMVLTYQDISDVCTLSGEELLKIAVDCQPKVEREDELFGIIITDNLMYCPDHPDYTFILLDISDSTKISYQNGEPASEEDLQPLSSIWISSDIGYASDPPQILCKRITIQ